MGRPEEPGISANRLRLRERPAWPLGQGTRIIWAAEQREQVTTLGERSITRRICTATRLRGDVISPPKDSAALPPLLAGLRVGCCDEVSVSMQLARLRLWIRCLALRFICRLFF